MGNQKLDDKASKAMSDLVLLDKKEKVDVWSLGVVVWSAVSYMWQFEEAKDMRPQKVEATKSYSKMSERSIMKENNRRLKWQTTTTKKKGHHPHR